MSPTPEQLAAVLRYPNGRLSEQPDSYEGGIDLRHPDTGEVQAHVSFDAKFGDCHMTVSVLAGLACSSQTLALTDEQIDDLMLGLGMMKRTRAEA